MNDNIIRQWLQIQYGMFKNAAAGLIRLHREDCADPLLEGFPQTADSLPTLDAAAQLAIRHAKPVIKAPDDTKPASSATLAIAHPLRLPNGNTGAVAFLLNTHSTEAGKEAIRRLSDSLQWLGQLLRSDCNPDSNPLGKLTRLIATTLTPDPFHQTATALTTELASELGCNRVFLGMRHARKTQLESISGTARPAQREAFSRAIRAAMDEASDQQQTICLPPTDEPETPAGNSHRVTTETAPCGALTDVHSVGLLDGVPTTPARPSVTNASHHTASSDLDARPGEQSGLAITHAHETLRTRFNTGPLCTVPLSIDNEVIGALTFEQHEDQTFGADEITLLEQFAAFLAPILQMKARTGKPLPERLREKAGRWKRWLFSWNGLSWKMLIVTALVAIMALATIPVAHDIAAPARLEGQVQRVLSSPQKGYIKAVHVRPGDVVHQGQVLIELEDRDLLLEKEKAQNEIDKLESRFSQALAARDRTELAVAQAGIDEARATLELVEKRLARTRLTAPFDGIVLEGDLTQSLGAPVEQGDKLVVLSPSRDFRIVLDTPEQAIDEVRVGLTGKIAFKALPSRSFDIEVTRITPVASQHDGHNIFETEARFLHKPATPLRPGLEGLARLNVDERPLLQQALMAARDWIDFRLWRWLGL